MKHLNETAKTMDTVFKVLEILAKIAFVATIVSLGIITIGFLFDLNPDMIGTGYGSLQLGSLELEIAESAIPSKKLILLQVATELLISLLITGIMIRCLGCLRSIVQPMADGTPFFQGVAQKLKTLAKYCLILGIAVNALQIISTVMMATGFDLENLLCSDKIIGINIHASLDATFLLAGAILLFLSYIFRHGEQLQQLSDETL